MYLHKSFHFLFYSALLTIFLLSLPGITLADSTTVVLSFPTPGPSPQDLAWDGECLWCADDSTDSLYRLDPSDGAIVSSFRAPGPEPRGLTWDGNYLWCSDDDSVEIYKMDSADGSIIFSIPAPHIILSGGFHSPISGLAWDGQYLWSSYYAGRSTSIVKTDPKDGTILESHFTRGEPEGLASDGIYLWYTSDRGGPGWLGLLRSCHIDPWYYEFKFETPRYFPSGLAYADGYLWLADTGVDTIYKLKIIPTVVEIPNGSSPPSSFMLFQNYPNPFNSETIISYELPFNARVSLTIFDIKGRLVKRVLVDRMENAGTNEVYWNGKGNYNRSVPSGVYFYQIKTQECIKTNKMTLIR